MSTRQYAGNAVERKQVQAEKYARMTARAEEGIRHFKHDHVGPLGQVQSGPLRQSQQRISQGHRNQYTSIKNGLGLACHSSSPPSGTAMPT
jgi:hypothetical protein